MLPTSAVQKALIDQSTRACHETSRRRERQVADDGDISKALYFERKYVRGKVQILAPHDTQAACGACAALIPELTPVEDLFPQNLSLPLRVADCLFFIDAEGIEWHSAVEAKLAVEIVKRSYNLPFGQLFGSVLSMDKSDRPPADGPPDQKVPNRARPCFGTFPRPLRRAKQ
jgi:hypothetical protein